MNNLSNIGGNISLDPTPRLLLYAFVALIILTFSAVAGAVEFTVNTTADTPDANPGDGVCADADSNCSLHAAVEETNADTTSIADDIVHLPAGNYTLTLGRLEISDDLTILGAGSDATIIDANSASGVIRIVGNIVYEKNIEQGSILETGELLPFAVATTLNDFPNCLASEGCLGKPGLVVDDGNSNQIDDPIKPIVFDFSEAGAIAGTDGFGILSITASRDLGHKIASSPDLDMLPTTVDGVTAGNLFRDVIDTCPPGENNSDLTCGPNFHNDVTATDSVRVSQFTMQTAAQDGTIRVVVSPPGTPPDDGNRGVGRLKIFDVNLQYVQDPQVNLTGLTIRRGNSQAGGGIRVDGGTVEISDARVEDNDGFSGGGGLFVNDEGTVTVRRTTFAGNEGTFGGAILNNGSLFVIDSLITNNNSTRAGGVRNSGTLNLRNTTVSGNQATAADAGTGGVSQNGFAFLNNATITDNTGVGNNPGSFQGGGIQTSSGETTVLKNSIIAGNDGGTGPNDCVGEFTSDSRYNLIGDTAGCTFLGLTTTYLLDLEPQLGPLLNNGGPTMTHLPFSGSPVINAGAPVPPGGPAADACEGADQRGVMRLICDMGAVERAVAVPDTLVVNTEIDGVDDLPGDGTCMAAGGLCSLRAAVQESNKLPNRQTIEIPTGFYDLDIPPDGEGGVNPASAGDLDLTEDVTLTGAARETTIIDANLLSRVFEVHPGVDADLFQLTMRRGRDSGGGGISSTSADLTLTAVIVEDNESTFDGGGVLSGLGLGENLTISDSIIRDNKALGFGSDGGGIAAQGVVVITDSDITGNEGVGSGGGIDASGTVTLTRVTVTGNQTTGSTFGNGGGISAGGMTLSDSTVSSNTAREQGGGIFAQNSTIINSTISGNTTTTRGGGLSTSAELTVINTTVAENSALEDGNGVFIFGSSASMILQNTILNNPGSGAECVGITAPTSSGNNISIDGTCGLSGLMDQPNTDPLLGPLADNGGSTLTHLPLAASPAIDNGTDAGLLVDQRGIARPQGAGFDIGAVEIVSVGVDLTGTVEDAGGTALCSLVLASGKFMFSCDPNGPFSLTGLPTENDGTVKRQVYVDGFFPNVEVLQGSVDETVVMTRAGTCPDYNSFPDPGVFPDSAGKRIDVSGTVLLRNTQTPICAMVLANGQYMFSCDGSGSYALNIPLDTNGQFKLQVYADGFAPTTQTYDEFQVINDVRMARAVECQ